MKPETTEVPTKKPRIMFTTDDDLKQALKEWADNESRTVGNLCEVIVRKAAKDAGYLQDDNPTDPDPDQD